MSKMIKIVKIKCAKATFNTFSCLISKYMPNKNAYDLIVASVISLFMSSLGPFSNVVKVVL